MTGGKVRQYPYFVGLFHNFTPLRGVELSKEWQRVHDGGKVRQYPYFARLLHTSTPPRSVELSKKWRNSGFHGQGWTWLNILEDCSQQGIFSCTKRQQQYYPYKWTIPPPPKYYNTTINFKSVSTISKSLQINYYLQWLENKDPLDPKPNNILEKKVRAEI